jgi:hypothetical protein
MNSRHTSLGNHTIKKPLIFRTKPDKIDKGKQRKTPGGPGVESASKH